MAKGQKIDESGFLRPVPYLFEYQINTRLKIVKIGSIIVNEPALDEALPSGAPSSCPGATGHRVGGELPAGSRGGASHVLPGFCALPRFERGDKSRFGPFLCFALLGLEKPQENDQGGITSFGSLPGFA